MATDGLSRDRVDALESSLLAKLVVQLVNLITLVVEDGHERARQA